MNSTGNSPPVAIRVIDNFAVIVDARRSDGDRSDSGVVAGDGDLIEAEPDVADVDIHRVGAVVQRTNRDVHRALRVDAGGCTVDHEEHRDVIAVVVQCDDDGPSEIPLGASTHFWVS